MKNSSPRSTRTPWAAKLPRAKASTGSTTSPPMATGVPLPPTSSARKKHKTTWSACKSSTAWCNTGVGPAARPVTAGPGGPASPKGACTAPFLPQLSIGRALALRCAVPLLPTSPFITMVPGNAYAVQDSKPMILVTGGAGFIGANFVLQALACGQDPVVNLDLLTYAGNLENLQSAMQHPRYQFVQGDIADEALLRRLLAAQQPRAIVHFAAESHVDRSILG